jgi:lipid-A-disaccharide synthase
VRHLGRIRGVYHRLLAEVDRDPPAAAVLVDYPDFNLRLARQLRRRDIPVVYYVSPQVWAWRRGRVRAIRETVARMLVIFPFEEALYRDAGVPVSFVGHPLVDLVRPPTDPRGFLASLGLDPERPVIGILPGSRPSEIAHNTPPLRGAIDRLRARRPELQFLAAAAPALDPAGVSSALGGTPVAEGQAHAVLSASILALVASGTATVEAALIGTPMIVVYRLAPLTYALGRPFVRVEHAAMANLIAGRRVVPELIQGEFTSDRVAAEALALLGDSDRRTAMRRDLLEIRQRLGRPGASDRAAEYVLSALEGADEKP